MSAPEPSTSEMSKPGPTVPTSCGLSAAVAAGRSAAAASARAKAKVRMPLLRHSRESGFRRPLLAGLGGEARAQRLDDPPAEARGVLVGERPLGRLVLDRERDGLAP